MTEQSAINWNRLRTDIINAAVGSVNGLLWDGLAKAQRDVPVRRVFAGDRRTVRYKTAEEIEKDKVLRARLGLAPEILATPARIAAARRAGVNPKKSRAYPNRTGLTNLETGELAGRDDVYGFARTVVRRDRANSWAETGLQYDEDMRPHGRRVLNRTERQLKNRDDESLLTVEGRYELRSGRAVAVQRLYGAARKPVVDLATGRIKMKSADRMGGQPTLGGGLRSTLRVEEADADQFPVIKGSLLAGDRDHQYAKFQELGTRHNAAQPFLRPRLPEWAGKLKARLKANIGRIGR